LECDSTEKVDEGYELCAAASPFMGVNLVSCPKGKMFETSVLAILDCGLVFCMISFVLDIDNFTLEL
jgi:hypothetical protein